MEKLERVYLLCQYGEVIDAFPTYELAEKAKYDGRYNGHWDSFEIEDIDMNYE